MQLLGKITPKLVCGEQLKTVPEKQTPLFNIIGYVEKADAKESTYGTSYAFSGEFKATNLVTGEIYAAKKAFLPRIAEGLVLDAVRELDKGSRLEMAFVIGIRPVLNDKADSSKYEWCVQPLLEIQETDAMKALEAKALARLDAPKQAEDAPTTKKSKK